jgi:hypothetical protein
MNFSKRELYAAGEPLGESATQHKPFGRIYGGGGGGGTQTSTSQMTIPDELKPAATAMSNVATQVGNSTWNPYTGQGVAPMNPYQNTAINMTAQRALGGDQTIGAGNQFLQNTLQSGPQQATMNPYGNISAGVNPFAGMNNPYLQQSIDNSINDLRTAYSENTLPQITSANIRSGSFGNSGLSEFEAQKQRDLAKQAGNISTSMRMQDYGNQMQLAESALGRDMGAQQFNAQMGGDWASRNDAMFQNSMGTRLNAAQLGLNYGNQAYQDAGQLMNMGQQAYNVAQDQNDFNYQQYMNQQNYPLQQLQALTGVLRGNSGTTTTTSGGGGK